MDSRYDTLSYTLVLQGIFKFPQKGRDCPEDILYHSCREELSDLQLRWFTAYKDNR